MQANVKNICFIFTIVFILIARTGDAIQCYQCSSAEDPDGEDNCGAYEKFRKEEHISYDCNSDESYTPGSFCMKVVQQSPVGFVWDGRWRQVIRRCASVADTGVTGVCNWGVKLNGIYWEECYCSEDGCNSAYTLHIQWAVLAASVCVSLFSFF